MDLIDDDRVFLPLCEYLNSLLSIIDFVGITNHLVSESFDYKANDPFILPVKDSQKRQIYKSNYRNVLTKIIRNIQIPKSCMDIYRSELEDGLLRIFIVAIREQTQQVTIEEHEAGYKVNCPAMISDLIMPLLSRFHSELLDILEQFSDYIKAVDGNASLFFLNAKGSNPISQYIQMWVAKELNILDRPSVGRCIVL